MIFRHGVLRMRIRGNRNSINESLERKKSAEGLEMSSVAAPIFRREGRHVGLARVQSLRTWDLG